MIIDFHAHILPGLDHGSRDVGMSLLQLRSARKAGIDCIAATSHFNPFAGTIDDYLARRQRSWDILREALTPDLPRIILGAEVLMCSNIDQMEGFMSLAFSGTSAVLIEMPFGAWNRDLIYTVEKVNEICKGHAVIAHVDRYDQKSMEYLFDMGVVGQINVTALYYLFRRRYLMKWVEQRYVVALGSDIHRGENTYRKFSRMSTILGDDFNGLMYSSERLCFPIRV
jgi:protein-tyrosine phosphatase